MPATEDIGYVTVGAGVAEELGTIAMLAGEPVGCGVGSTPQTATGTAAVAPGDGVGGRIIRSTVTAGAAALGASHTKPTATMPATKASAEESTAAYRLLTA